MLFYPKLVIGTNSTGMTEGVIKSEKIKSKDVRYFRLFVPLHSNHLIFILILYHLQWTSFLIQCVRAVSSLNP